MISAIYINRDYKNNVYQGMTRTIGMIRTIYINRNDLTDTSVKSTAAGSLLGRGGGSFTRQLGSALLGGVGGNAALKARVDAIAKAQAETVSSERRGKPRIGMLPSVHSSE